MKSNSAKARRKARRKKETAALHVLPEDWKRCGGCGRLVKVPPRKAGHGCPGCGTPLSRAREP